MENPDIVELIEKGKSDGAQLYSIADALHKFAIILIALIAISGIIFSFAAMTKVGFLSGILFLAGTAIICMLLYAADIVVTNSSKVLVHILFSNLVIIEGGKK